MSNNMFETHIIGNGTRQFTRNSMDCPALAAAGIDALGFGDMGKGYYSERLKPSFSHMAGCFAGSGEVYSGGAWMPFVPGMNVFQPAGYAHAARKLDGSPFSYFWIILNCNSSLLKNRAFQRPCQINRSSLTVSGAVMELCNQGMGRRGASANLEKACSQLICAWLDELTADDKPGGRLEPLWLDVERHLERKWNARSLAKVIGVSPTHLRRLCSDESGMSPMKKLTMLRVERAKTLMSMMNMKMDEVAEMVGYANMFAFSTAFKRHTGISPGYWRDKANKSS